MGNVILFRKAQKKREMEEELWERKARIEDAIKSMEKIWENAEKEEEKYNDMPKMKPISAAAKIQYLAAGMIKLVPDIFHSNDWNIQFDTWMYFYDLYIMEFYPANKSYINENKKFERPYFYNA